MFGPSFLLLVLALVRSHLVQAERPQATLASCPFPLQLLYVFKLQGARAPDILDVHDVFYTNRSHKRFGWFVSDD